MSLDVRSQLCWGSIVVMWRNETTIGTSFLPTSGHRVFQRTMTEQGVRDVIQQSYWEKTSATIAKNQINNHPTMGWVSETCQNEISDYKKETDIYICYKLI